MPFGVVVDTSYLITLADLERPNHKTAERHWIYFKENEWPVFLPTIVVSEFCVKQKIPDKILRSCIVLPFNWDDAMFAAELDFSRGRQADENRDALKDDVKILAVAEVNEAAFVITDDSKTFYRFGKQMESEGKAAFRTIKLDDGFDLAHFNGGQRELFMSEEDAEADQ